jgi:hypothetical protein
VESVNHVASFYQRLGVDAMAQFMRELQNPNGYRFTVRCCIPQNYEMPEVTADDLNQDVRGVHSACRNKEQTAV